MNIYENHEQQIEVHHVPESERLVPLWDLKTVKTNSPAPEAANPRQSRLSELLARGRNYERSEPQVAEAARKEPDRSEPNLDWC